MSEGLYSMEAKDFDKTLDFTKIKPYGDTMNDGKVQLSFTLPVPCGAEAVEAAKQLLRKMGFDNPSVVYYKELTPGFTFFNCYGSCTHTVDYSTIYVPKVESNTMGMYETDEYIKENLGRKIVIVGASTGTDAHTVGIDAIMNMKGYAGHYGLERYEMIEAYNLGSQVPSDKMICCCGGARITHELAKELGFDAGFGMNTYADDVASFVVQEMVKRGMK